MCGSRHDDDDDGKEGEEEDEEEVWMEEDSPIERDCEKAVTK